MTTSTDRQILDQGLRAYTAQGWRVVSQTDHGFSVTQPKQLNPVGMVIFVMMPALFSCIAFLIAPAWGIVGGSVALLGLFLVVLDYALKNDRVAYVTADQLRGNARNDGRRE